MIATIQTTTRREQILRQYLDAAVQSQLVSEIFVPKREVMKRFRGEWVKRTELFFPGYLFVETPDALGLFLSMKRIPMLSKMLGDLEISYTTLTPGEEAFIRRIGAGRGDHTFQISQVQIESENPYQKGDHVTIVSGDLKDFQGEIIGFDFHKRKAMIQTGLFGGTVLHVGIELLKKE